MTVRESDGEFAASVGERSLRVLVVAAYPAVRAGLGALLARDPALLPVSPEPLPVSAGAWFAGAEPAADLSAIVVDLSGLPDGIADELGDAYPGVPQVLLGADPAMDGPGLQAGAVAYLTPDADAPTLAAAVRGVSLGLTVLDPALAVAAGVHVHGRAASHAGIHPLPAAGAAGEPLTARERQVLTLVAAGLPNKAIARELGISEHTAKFHVGSLLTKLGAASRTEAVTLATRRGLLAV